MDVDESFERGFGDAIDDLYACGSSWIDDARFVLGDLVDDREFDLAVASVVRVRYALVPPGYCDPVMDPDELADAFDLEMDKFFQAARAPTPRDLMGLLEQSRQPALVQLIIAEYLAGMSKLPKKERPRSESELPVIILLKVMIDELDRALRNE